MGEGGNLRSDTDETGNGTGTEPNGRPLPLQPKVQQHPGNPSHGSRQVGNRQSHHGPQVGRESRPPVEPEPTHPEEDRPQNDEESVMRLVRQSLRSITPSLPEVNGHRQSRHTGRDVYGSTSGEIESTEDVRPTASVPGPAGDGAVDDGEPDEHPDHDGTEAATFGETAGGEGDGDAGEHVLVCGGRGVAGVNLVFPLL